MPTFPQQGGSENTWGTELRNFFATYFDLTTGVKGYPSGVRELSASAVLTSADRFVFVDATLAPAIITLPLLSSLVTGQEIEIQKADSSANNVTFTTQGTDTITSNDGTDITLPYEVRRFVKRSATIYQAL